MINKNFIYCVAIVILIVGGSLLIASFTYIDYNEYAFRRNKLKNTVYTTKVYKNGRYLWGPNINTLRFPRDYQKIDFSGDNALSVSNDDGTAFYVDVSFFYRLIPDDLDKLYTNFGTEFESKVKSISQSTLKNTAILYDIEDYLQNRQLISSNMNKNVSEVLKKIWVDVETYKLQLKHIEFTDTIKNKYLDAAIQLQNNAKVTYQQQASLVRQETTKLVEAINANTTIVSKTATANYNKIIEVAKAQALEITSTAKGNGISSIIANLSIDTSRQLFIKLMGILDNDGVKIVDLDGNVVINV